MSVRIVQYLCPSRHCIIAVAYEEGRANRAEAEEMMRTFMVSMNLNPWCGICASPRLRFEEAKTCFETMEEAAPTLAALQAGQMLAREIYGMKPKSPN